MPPRETDGHAVEVELGLSENLGDFNNAKVHVRVHVPCTAATLREAGRFAYSEADAMFNEYREDFVTSPDA